nr:MAG TPA: hypothetical protein [Caudoviricetes sp.]
MLIICLIQTTRKLRFHFIIKVHGFYIVLSMQIYNKNNIRKIVCLKNKIYFLIIIYS